MAMEKAKYRVLRLSHIHNNLWPEGSEIEYDGEPGSALEPINAAAKAAKKKADQKRGIVPVDSQPEPRDEDDVQEDTGGNDSNTFSEDEAALRQQYEELFNKKPGNMNVETIKERIAEERQKLGV
ncbi:hypothetical protein E7934_13370 [Salmonella enterica]|uniref:Uncharacterized protein n=2 Tax=Salmonella enterica TaxID=28901 RepID=A0A5U2UMB3_SALER|nr:hypothetical protein [Salmonella enterica]ECM4281408.1 hypothetical protein [Salmonella enterica subsp. enterica serovar Heidelberg]EDW1661560.1 hypothetical protein [Salmonella enterica subsp. enterica serovar Typhimurium]MCE1444808.1 hypothetical protein [Enterobacter hormaechei]EAM7697145.1 hypothetical protein [Salmonella enterica]EAN7682877.1 hypothetical protein [Salmonella enterica]